VIGTGVGETAGAGTRVGAGGGAGVAGSTVGNACVAVGRGRFGVIADGALAAGVPTLHAAANNTKFTKNINRKDTKNAKVLLVFFAV
jgi:hypothetical protein